MFIIITIIHQNMYHRRITLRTSEFLIKKREKSDNTKLPQGNGNSLQDSCLENSMDKGAWCATVHGSQRVRHNWMTSIFTFTFIHALLPRKEINMFLEYYWLIKIANIHFIIKNKREFQKNIHSALLTMPKPLTVWITINCGKFFKSWEFQTTWPASWETYMQVRKHNDIMAIILRKKDFQICIW